MYNIYPEETKRNVVAAIRAGVTPMAISRKTGIPKSTAAYWNNSAAYRDVPAADEEILNSLSTYIPEMNLVKVPGDNTGMSMNHYHDKAVRIRTSGITIELDQSMSASDLVAIITALRG
ncbi:MAG: hypothetical protein ACI4TM_04115 [Candidatus Cryptobacteroides sp.]